MLKASAAPAPETEVAIAMRRIMQAEASVTQAEARVMQQWSVVQTIAAKLPKEQHVEELKISQAALDFAQAAHTRAIKVCDQPAAELAEAKERAAAATLAPDKRCNSSSSSSSHIDAARKASSIDSRLKISNQVLLLFDSFPFRSHK